MTGLVIAAVGWVCLVVGVVLLFGPWALAASGAVTLPAGLLVDWEKVHGKRH